jgi:hypothetical protein
MDDPLHPLRDELARRLAAREADGPQPDLFAGDSGAPEGAMAPTHDAAVPTADDPVAGAPGIDESPVDVPLERVP